MNPLWRLAVVVFLWGVKIVFDLTACQDSRFGAILTNIQCQNFESVCVLKQIELLQFLAQTLGQNYPKPLKSKRSRRELSNGVV